MVVVPGPAPEEQVAGDTGVEQISTVETTVVGTQVEVPQSLQFGVLEAAGALLSPRGFTGLALAKRLLDKSVQKRTHKGGYQPQARAKQQS